MKVGGYEIQVPFVTTSVDHLRTILEFAEIREGMKVVDLGSGDGRMVLEFAKKGAVVTGYEIKPELVERSMKRINEAKLQNRVSVYKKDFWSADLSEFDLIYIYGMGSIMGRLEKKLDEEMRTEAKFISNVFTLPHWKIKATKNAVNFYSRRNQY